MILGRAGIVASPKASQAAGRLPVWLLFTAYALTALAIRLPWLGDPATGYDEQLYHLFGVRMLDGDVPYVDLWDRKPVLLFVIFAIGALIGGQSVLGYQALVVLAAAIGAMQSHAIARRLGDWFAAAIAGFLYLLIFPLFDTPMGQAEVFYLPLLLGMVQALIAVFDRDTAASAVRPALLAMILGGLALQIKYTVLPHCLFAGLAALWRFRQMGADWRALIRHGALFALAGLAPTLALAGFYAAKGHFDAFFYANFVSIFERGSIADANLLANLRQIAILSAWFGLLAVIALGLVAAGKRRPGKPFMLVAGFFAASLMAAAMVGNVYIHYFIPAAVALMLLGVPAFSPGALNRVLAGLALGLVFFFGSIPFRIYLAREDRGPFATVVSEVRPYVGSRNNCLFVYEGVPGLYLATQSCLPTRFIFPDQLNSAQEANAIGTDASAELRRILASRPGAVVTKQGSTAAVPNRTNRAILNAELARSYTLTRSIATPSGTFEVWVPTDRLAAVNKFKPAIAQ